MSLGVSFTIDTGRALMAAMQPITGNRAAGTIRLRTEPGVTMTIPRNSYWMPIVDGQRATSWLFKAMSGPNDDLSWTVDDSGTSEISLMSNIGGMRHNVDAGTAFQPDIPIAGLVREGADAPVAVGNFAGATNPADYCGVQDMALYETFDGPALTTDLHRSPIDRFPGVLLAFQDFTPADGVAIASNNQQAVNAGEGKKFYKVSYTISVVVTKGEGDASRRQEGLLIADTIAQLLNDKKMGDPGECLSNPGGVQIRQMLREDGPQPIYKKVYIYTLLVSATVMVKRLDFRTFSPWLRSVMAVDVPQTPNLPNQGAYRLVDDVHIDMTPGSMDLAIDGTFARASDAHLWSPESTADGNGVLSAFTAGQRRTTTPELGVTMEPAVANDLGAAAEDMTAWTPADGATVTPDVEFSPLGALTADRVDFTANAASRLEYTGPVAPAGAPVVFYVFAKATGTKFTTSLRLAAVDFGSTVYTSDDIEVSNVWTLYRFEFVPTTPGAVTLQLQNASDAGGRAVMLWGAFYSDSARWGAEYMGAATKAQDALTFLPRDPTGYTSNEITPEAVLSGRWALRFVTPRDVPPDTLGTATGDPGRTLVSVGDGATELVTLTLVGTPGSGGAALTLSTRGAGLEVSVAGLEWVPGDELRFVVDAVEGTLTIEGSLNGDGEYSFERYAEDALPADFLVVGDTSSAGSSPTPGSYVAVEYNV